MVCDLGTMGAGDGAVVVLVVRPKEGNEFGVWAQAAANEPDPRINNPDDVTVRVCRRDCP